MSLDLGGYGNTVLGGITLAVLAGIGWCVRNKFKHSRCDLDSGCLKVSSRDDERKSTIRLEVLEEFRREGLIPPLVPKLSRLPVGPGFTKPALETDL